MKKYPNVCAGCGKPAQPNDSLCRACSDKIDKTVLSFDVPVHGELFGKKKIHNPPE